MTCCDPTPTHGKELGNFKNIAPSQQFEKIALSNALRIVIKNRTLTLKTYPTDYKFDYYR